MRQQTLRGTKLKIEQEAIDPQGPVVCHQHPEVAYILPFQDGVEMLDGLVV